MLGAQGGCLTAIKGREEKSNSFAQGKDCICSRKVAIVLIMITSKSFISSLKRVVEKGGGECKIETFALLTSVN